MVTKARVPFRIALVAPRVTHVAAGHTAVLTLPRGLLALAVFPQLRTLADVDLLVRAAE